MIITKYNISFLICIILLLVSCNFEDDMIDEDTIIDPDFSELFEPTVSQIAYNQIALPGRAAGILMQYFKENDAEIMSFTNYNLTNATFNAYWTDGLYNGSLKQIQDLLEKSQNEGNTDMEAIATILKAHEYLHATTLFGDLPYTEALQGSDNINPVYDSQESIYQALLSLCDTAIDMIGNNGVNTSLSDIDIIYEGDMTLWKKFAYAIKARMYLHLSTRNPSRYDQVLSSIEASFSSNSEHPTYKWLQHNSLENPLYAFSKERPSTIAISDYFLNILHNNSDPRMDYITTTIDSFQWLFQQDDPFEFRWTATTGTLPLLSYSELCFMKAETLLLTGASDSEVVDALREGIIANCQEYNIDPPIYQAYTDQQASLNGLNTTEEKLELIIMEAYSAYYGKAFIQSWNNYKRLGIPALVPTGSESDINPSGSVPVRYQYPQSEIELNTEHVFDAISNQNGALLDRDLWVFDQ